MPVHMEPHELAFWRELLAPFPEEYLSETSRGGKKLTYVDKRAIDHKPARFRARAGRLVSR